MTALRDRLQCVLERRFPGIRLVEYDDGTDCDMFHVFFISDDSVSDFMDFLISEYANIARENELPLVSLMPHSVSNTLKYYPWVNQLNSHENINEFSNDIVHAADAPLALHKTIVAGQ